MNMFNKLIALSAMALVLTGCSSATTEQVNNLVSYEISQRDMTGQKAFLKGKTSVNTPVLFIGNFDAPVFKEKSSFTDYASQSVTISTVTFKPEGWAIVDADVTEVSDDGSQSNWLFQTRVMPNEETVIAKSSVGREYVLYYTR